ncbi:MAG: hypothetical protein LT070_06315 [Solirubrobacteraceae bacterium]|nr:hypothetical protein [Solirubrobacteraceae bacterium]
MARVVAVVPDLLFGSHVQGALEPAGHEVVLAGSEAVARAALANGADVLVVDLAADECDGAALVRALRAEGTLGAARTLGFYPHVEVPARERGLTAGLDLVVPRSRMRREAAALVERLLAERGTMTDDGPGSRPPAQGGR